MYIQEHNLFLFRSNIMDRLYLASYKQTPEQNTRLDIKLKIDRYIQLMIIDIQSTTQHWKLW